MLAVLLLVCVAFDVASGTCLINADTCSNKATDTLCQMAFTDISQCENATFAQDAAQCRKTCLLCCEDPEYSCGDAADPATGGVNCVAIATAKMCQTSDATYNALMLRDCAGSCGLCTDAGRCPDKDPDMCAALKTMCQNVDYYTLMQENCVTTCGFPCDVTIPGGVTTATTGAAIVTTTTTAGGGSGTCVNTATNCAENAALCNNAIYYDLMTQKCPVTCGRCSGSSGGGGGGSTCTNANSNCATWVANGFCTSTFYTSAQKLQYCGQSCNLC